MILFVILLSLTRAGDYPPCLDDLRQGLDASSYRVRAESIETLYRHFRRRPQDVLWLYWGLEQKSYHVRYAAFSILRRLFMCANCHGEGTCIHWRDMYPSESFARNRPVNPWMHCDICDLMYDATFPEDRDPRFFPCQRCRGWGSRWHGKSWEYGL